MLSLVLSWAALVAPVVPCNGDLAEARAAAREVELPQLAVEDLERWKRRVIPGADELSWRAIPWISRFDEGFRTADRERKPVLFWAMNGHPLGCT